MSVQVAGFVFGFLLTQHSTSRSPVLPLFPVFLQLPSNFSKSKHYG